MKRSLIVLVVAGLVCGCASEKKKPTPKEAALKQWNAARASVLAGLAKDQYENGNLDRAKTTVDEALRMDPTNPQLHLLAARLAIESGQLETAESELKKARELDPKNAEADYLSGIVCQRWQRLQAAADFYAEAANKNPNELAYVLAQSEMLVAMDKPADALELLQSKTDTFDHSAVLRDAIGQLQVQQGKLPEALETLHQAATLASDDTGIREHYAVALFKAKKYSEAGENLTRLMHDEKFQKRVDLLVMRGDCEAQAGKLREARTTYEDATRLDASQSAAWLSLARVSVELNDLDRAETALKRANTIDPAATQGHVLMGYVRLKQNRLADALAAFRKAVAIDPKDATAVSMVGYVLEKQGHPDQALQFYSQALKIDPKDELATKLMAGVDLHE